METKSFFFYCHIMLLSPSVLKMVEREIPMQIKQNVFISNELDEILRDTVETLGVDWYG